MKNFTKTTQIQTTDGAIPSSLKVMPLRTETEIMQNWGGAREPVVSICCTTFNHEEFIQEAINSFLMQETDFPFEIIVRDDCSIDETSEIIDQYADVYPNINIMK